MTRSATENETRHRTKKHETACSVDIDMDGAPNGCDECPAPDLDDSDFDGVCDANDVCFGFDDNQDADGDGIPDGCDTR